MLQFCSVLSLPATSGNIEFEIETYNASENITFSIPATGIEATDDEIDVAKRIYTSINNYLTVHDLQYSGPLTFHDQEVSATFRVHRTDHVICLFSQSHFSLKVTTNDPGCRLPIGVSPTLLTLHDARNLASVSGIDLETEDEEELTDNQLQELLEIGSARLVELLNNNIVICTYVKEFVGNGERAIPLDEGKPGIFIDTPNTRRPYSLYITSEDSSGSPSNYGWVRPSGYLRYRFAQGMIASDQPFKIGSEFNISYVAGNFNIPKIIKLAVLYLVNELINASGSGLSNSEGDLRRLTGGNLTVEFFNSSTRTGEFFFELRAFII